MRKSLLLGALAISGTMMVSAIEPQFKVKSLDAKLAQQRVEKVCKVRNSIVAKSSKNIVSVKPLKNGNKLNVVKDLQGGLHKELVKPLKSRTPFKLQSRKSAIQKATSTASLYESFEGWDGETPNWIPEDWTEINSSDSIVDMNSGTYTWFVSNSGYFDPEAMDGDNMCMIYFAGEYDDDGNFVTYPQDEWLISPEVTPKENEVLSFGVCYVPLFLFNIDDEHVDWETLEFKKVEPAATLKVLISVDGGEWIEKTDLFNLHKDETFLDLYYNYAGIDELTFETMKIDVSEYVGKKIKVAFQYVGEDGNTMYIDCVKLGVPEPQASYWRPQGSFYFGFNENYDFLCDSEERSLMLMPVYTPLEWINTSNNDAESYSWYYEEPETADDAYSTDENLVVQYPYDYSDEMNNWHIVPELTASATGAEDNTYAWYGIGFQTGGKAQYAFEEGEEPTQYFVGNYDYHDGFYALQDDNGPLYGYYDGLDDVWTDLFGLTKSDDSYVHLTSIGNFFEPPTHTYGLSKVIVHASGEISDDAQFKISVFPVDEYGYLSSDTLATATCSGSDAVKYEGTELFTLPFNLKQKDEETGLETEGTLSISSAIYVALEGFDEGGVTSFGALQSGPAASEETNGYFSVNIVDEGEAQTQMYPLSALSTAEGFCYSSFLFGLDANYSWIECEATEYELATEGETKSVSILASENPEDWSIEIPEDCDWLSVEATGTKDDAKLTFTAQAMPDGSKSRECEVIVYVEGSYKVFTITQGGNSAITTAQTKAKVSVNTAGGNFNIIANNNVNNVKVYDMAGKLVKSAKVNGTTTVDAQALASGVYVLRFNEGSVVKVRK